MIFSPPAGGWAGLLLAWVVLILLAVPRAVAYIVMLIVPGMVVYNVLNLEGDGVIPAFIGIGIAVVLSVVNTLRTMILALMVQLPSASIWLVGSRLVAYRPAENERSLLALIGPLPGALRRRLRTVDLAAWPHFVGSRRGLYYQSASGGRSGIRTAGVVELMDAEGGHLTISEREMIWLSELLDEIPDLTAQAPTWWSLVR